MNSNWKTTAAGILSALIAVLTTLCAYQMPDAVLNPHASHVWLYITVGANLLCAICRALLGLIQVDAQAPPAPTSQGGTQ